MTPFLAAALLLAVTLLLARLAGVEAEQRRRRDEAIRRDVDRFLDSLFVEDRRAGATLPVRGRVRSRSTLSDRLA
ncbi:MAG TPA: hypothetical protein VI854_01555 [Acidimicrobiia bacterium]|nr:hypothetical protein [Acidimicrobiia bacterium]